MVPEQDLGNHTSIYRAWSVRQPFAHAIQIGKKDWENKCVKAFALPADTISVPRGLLVPCYKCYGRCDPNRCDSVLHIHRKLKLEKEERKRKRAQKAEEVKKKEKGWL